MNVVFNMPKDEAKEMIQNIKNNDGHCLCMLKKTVSTMCMCDSFKSAPIGSVCHCGLYRKIS